MCNVFSRYENSETYAHHLHFMFYPSSNECGFKIREALSYCSTFQEVGMMKVITKNKNLV